MKYRKKPTIVDAIQWTGDNEREMEQFISTKFSITYNEPEIFKTWTVDTITTKAHIREKQISIDTLEGTMIADKGDLIIKGVNGEFYPCKPDVFEKTYEKAE